jgi:IS4 transposase
LENLQYSTELLKKPQNSVHIGDRENDIYELFCMVQQLETHFLVRTCVDRLAGDGKHTIKDEMKKEKVKGIHKIKIKNDNGKLTEVVLNVKFRRIKVLPPIGKKKQCPELTLTIIYAQEKGKTRKGEKINWKLITDLPINSLDNAIQKLEWYTHRWKIETFFKILKSGCRAEESKLRTAERIVNLISIFCILIWRIFWMTMINRSAIKVTTKLVFTKNEICLLDILIKDKSTVSMRKKPLSHYINKLD